MSRRYVRNGIVLRFEGFNGAEGAELFKQLIQETEETKRGLVVRAECRADGRYWSRSVSVDGVSCSEALVVLVGLEVRVYNAKTGQELQSYDSRPMFLKALYII